MTPLGGVRRVTWFGCCFVLLVAGGALHLGVASAQEQSASCRRVDEQIATISRRPLITRDQQLGARDDFHALAIRCGSPWALLQQGLMQAQLEEWADGWNTIRQALRFHHPLVDTVRDARDLRDIVQRIEQHVAIVNLVGVEPGARVSVDGAAFDLLRSDPRVAVVAGRLVTLEVVSSDGSRRWLLGRRFGPGDVSTEQVVLAVPTSIDAGPPGVTDATVDATEPSDVHDDARIVDAGPPADAHDEDVLDGWDRASPPNSFPFRTVGWVTAAGGAALAIVGAVFWGFSYDNAIRMENACMEGTGDPYLLCRSSTALAPNNDIDAVCPSNSTNDLCVAQRNYRNFALGFGLSGLALATAGVLTVVLAPQDSGSRISFVPWFGPNARGATFGLQF